MAEEFQRLEAVFTADTSEFTSAIDAGEYRVRSFGEAMEDQGKSGERVWQQNLKDVRASNKAWGEHKEMQRGVQTETKGMRKEFGLAMLGLAGFALGAVQGSKSVSKAWDATTKIIGGGVDLMFAGVMTDYAESKALLDAGDYWGAFTTATGAATERMLLGPLGNLIWDTSKQYIEAWAGGVREDFAELGAAAGVVGGQISEFGSGLGGNIAAGATEASNALVTNLLIPGAETLGMLSHSAQEIGRSVETGASEGVAGAQRWLTEGAGSLSETFEDVGEEAIAAVEKLIPGFDVQESFDTLVSAAGDIGDALMDPLGTLEDFGGTIGKDAQQTFENMADEAEKIKTSMADALSDAIDFLGQAWDKAGDYNPFSG